MFHSFAVHHWVRLEQFRQSGIVITFHLFLAINAYLVIPAGVTSFDSELHEGIQHNNVFALVMFVILALSFGISWCCPWMLVSEVFPFRVRGTALGIAAAMNYVAVFTVSKTYLSLELGLNIWGAFALYAVFLFFG